MRARLACLALAAVAPLVGCQSGAVEVLTVSADGQVLIFRDVFHGTPYAADAKGVRPVRIPAGNYYYLAPGKAWLVSTRRHEPRSREEALGPRREWITLVNLETGEQFESEFPFELPQLERTGHADSAPMWLLAGPEIFLGPIARHFYGWTGKEAPVASTSFYGWHWRPREDAHGWVGVHGERAAAIKSRARSIVWGAAGRDSCIVQVPSDGSTARRSIWVRPNGSTLELSRKNDGLFWCVAGLGFTLSFPVYVPLGALEDRVPDSPIDKLSRATAGWASGSFFTWATAVHGTKPDPVGAAAALTELDRLVNERRAADAPGDQP